MADVSLKESVVLPSKGLVYGVAFDPKITLRSMTTLDELKRNSKYDTEYKVMSDIIEGCIEEELPVHVYDMCIGDYQFLLHKLRVVTYGRNYKMYIRCPQCGEIVESKVDLDTLTPVEFEDSVPDNKIILPISGKEVKLSFQTPRMLDEVDKKAKELSKKNKDNIDYRPLFLTMSYIKEYDGKELDPVKLEAVVRKIPLKDLKYINQKGDELNRKVGIDTEVIAKCPKCGFETVTTFCLGPDFWDPSFDN